MKAGRQRWVDVAFGTVANHPGFVWSDLVASEDGSIGGRILFRNDLDAEKIRRKARAANLVCLLSMIAFGHEEQAMTSCQIVECFFDHRQEFNLLFGDGVCESHDAAVLLLIQRDGAETFETCNERAPEAGESVAVREDGFAFDSVELLAHFRG